MKKNIGKKLYWYLKNNQVDDEGEFYYEVAMGNISNIITVMFYKNHKLIYFVDLGYQSYPFKLSCYSLEEAELLVERVSEAYELEIFPKYIKL